MAQYNFVVNTSLIVSIPYGLNIIIHILKKSTRCINQSHIISTIMTKYSTSTSLCPPKPVGQVLHRGRDTHLGAVFFIEARPDQQINFSKM